MTVRAAYHFRDDIVAADVVFEAEADSLAELLEQCGLALENTMVEDLAAIQPKVRREWRFENESAEQVVFEFLQELIFLKDAELLVFGKIGAKAEKKGTGWVATVTLEGEPIDGKRHEQLVDVKAVTYHMYKVEVRGGRWKAFVVLDV